MRGLNRRLRHKAELFPDVYDLSAVGTLGSIRGFDQKIVAPYCGFDDADDYYYRSASARVIDRVAVPTLVLVAQDDPFIRLTPETRARVLANPNITFVETAHGGHCAFLARRSANGVHWAEAVVIRFLQAVNEGTFAPAAVPNRRFTAKIRRSVNSHQWASSSIG